MTAPPEPDTAPLAPRAPRIIGLDHGDPEAKREELRRYFHATFDADEALFEHLAGDEVYYQRADPLRHPLIFYFGHTACFFINKLLISGVIDRRIDPILESICAIGVDEMSWDDLDETHYDWPSVDTVRAYRQRVRERVDDLIGHLPLELPIRWESPFWLIAMGIEHARIHLETSSVLMRQLPLDSVRPSPRFPVCELTGEPPVNELLEVAGGPVTIGRTRDHGGFGWDTEYGAHEAQVPAFRASRHLVSNREFLSFVEAGGYREEKWWSEEGWGWREHLQAEHPLFWRRRETGSWGLRCLAVEIDLPWNWPVEVNQLEAKAFCNWLSVREGKKIRLPSEDEWRLLHRRCGLGDSADGDDAPANINLEQWASSGPVDRFPHGEFFDVIGNVWQWTETPIYPFEGFAVHPAYDDFSTPTFDDRHNLILGGSWISTGNEASADARYAFRRHFYQHAGFRYVEAEHAPPAHGDPYIGEPDVTRTCAAHWGEDSLGLDNFYVQLAGLCREQGAGGGRALHLNCGAGRLVFELTRDHEYALGLDFSARFVRVCDTLHRNGQVHHTLAAGGEIVTFHEIRLDGHGLDSKRDRAAFFQDNAANLQAKWGTFDLLVVTDLLDNMPDPRAFLSAVHRFVKPGGLLVLSSAWQWKDERTPREGRLGGYKDDTGENRTESATLRELLGDHFTLLGDATPLRRTRHENARRITVLEESVSSWRRRATVVPAPVARRDHGQ
jgi:5-histidylcysteine sulfoxide synthase/putative 4-mercaptohistidine N1-methyltranferase